ncbi:MAG: hypothetical protein KKF62_03925 [Bacteroidetes bacterium]|nr:hypothetical protein [Bacteroidota bacterium]MBU1116484.1 hypothetical protein [Bacteroidota bacterium]MBU1800504.1 hypothetical protein [Bacteroidota bacterium]
MKQFKFIILFGFLLIFSSSLFAQKVDEYEMHQLRAISKLDKFGVYVWDFEGDKWNKKISEPEVQKFVQKALKGAGIKTVDFSDARTLEGAPNLEVSIKVDEKAKSGLFAYSVIMRFIQDAKLIRNNVLNYGAITWERDDVGFTTKEDLDLELKISINSLIDEFILDYKKVN